MVIVMYIAPACCTHEVFGLPLVEDAFGVYFASREMLARLEQRCAEARGAHNRPAVPAP